MNYSYIAGFFDGEGTVYSNNDKINVSIPQTNFEVLNEIVKFCGVGNVYKTKKIEDHHKDAWVLRIAKREDVLAFLENIVGFTILKKQIITSFIVKLKEREIIENDKLDTRKIEMEKVVKHVNDGFSYRKISSIMNFSRQKVCTLIKENGILG